MHYLTDKKFSFASKAVDEKSFGVVSFSGSEGLSLLYQFDITLISDSGDIDLDGVMEKPASFFIHRPDGSKVPFHGIIAECDMIQGVGSYFLYRVCLVPKLWRLTLTHHNQIFLNVTAENIITEVLKDGGLTSLDFEFRLQGSYVTWEYACQYGESHYSFVCRWMEQNGIYFFFDQSGDSEKLIMTDSKMSHVAASFGTDLTYAPVSGLEAMHLDEAVQSYICRRQQLPKNVTLQNYNYRKPSLEVQGKAEVCPTGHGELYFYGDHFRTPEEGNRLAKIRSEEFLCKEKQFHGESTVPYLMPGYTFALNKHFNDTLNRNYLTLSMEHQGNQAAFLISGIQENLTGIELESSYRNSFTAMENDVQFRAERVTERPRLHGFLNGWIDAAGSGKYAELDALGRYKVILPFDQADREAGKASAWVRMMQPYSGSDHGMHFPLHKGCEVLLSFIDGDPDQPIITGTVANPLNPSQITSKNQDHCVIKTCGGNEIDFCDKADHQRIVIQSPVKESFIKIGDKYETKSSTAFSTGKDVIGDIISYKQTAIRLGLDLAGLIVPASGLTGEVDKGVTISTQEGLKIETVNKDESVGGYTQPGTKKLSVVGANFSSITGYCENSIKGYFDETIMGKRNQLIVGSNSATVMGWKKYFTTKKDEFIAKANKVKGAVTKISEKTTKIAGYVSKAYESVTEIFAEKNKVGEEEIEMMEMKTETIAEKTDMAGERTDMTGEKTDMTGESTKMGGEDIELVEMKTSMSGEKTELTGETTALSGEKTSLAGEDIELVEMKMTL